jgi:hypothetical protein
MVEGIMQCISSKSMFRKLIYTYKAYWAYVKDKQLAAYLPPSCKSFMTYNLLINISL